MEFEDLAEEQKAKARSCKNAEELIALAASEGIELTDDQLKHVAGGIGQSCMTMHVTWSSD